MITGNLSYMKSFIDRIGIPDEAKAAVLAAENRILADEKVFKEFCKLKKEYMDGSVSLGDTLSEITQKSIELGVSEYTLHFNFLINCTDILFEKYKSNNIDELIFWDTMDDFRCKLLECHDVKETWGTFVAHWFDGFLKFNRFALGRFQYEENVYDGEVYNKYGIVLNKGDKVYGFHIPSSGKPFDKAARLESYRKAYQFYGCREKGEKLVLTCGSWLLYKELENILPGDSKIVDFMHDFDIVRNVETEEFGDSWRIFGKNHLLPPDRLPTTTSLQKAIAKHLSAGGKLGYGFGIIVFDGDNIVNR